MYYIKKNNKNRIIKKKMSGLKLKNLKENWVNCEKILLLLSIKNIRDYIGEDNSQRSIIYIIIYLYIYIW